MTTRATDAYRAGFEHGRNAQGSAEFDYPEGELRAAYDAGYTEGLKHIPDLEIWVGVDGVPRVQSRPRSDQDSGPLVRSWAALRRTLEVSNLDELAAAIQDAADWPTWAERDQPGTITVGVSGRGTVLAYPFRLGELWDTVAALDREVSAAAEWDSLAEQIREVEGFTVQVSDWSEQQWDEPGYCPAYPYKRAAPGDMTFAAWRERRFVPSYPDFEVTAPRADGSAFGPNTRLKTLRAITQQQ